jgi:hypothetical protein
MDSERWQRVAHLYEAVLEREPGERAAFLTEATGDDDGLRREVESLLEHDSMPVLIDEPMLATAAAMLDDGASDLKTGALLGPYWSGPAAWARCTGRPTRASIASSR